MQRLNRELEWKGDSFIHTAATYLICDLLQDELIGVKHVSEIGSPLICSISDFDVDRSPSQKMRSAIVCGKELSKACRALGVTHDIHSRKVRQTEHCYENTFEAICGAMMQHLGYERAVEWVNYALINVIIDAWKVALKDKEARFKQRMAKRKAAEEASDFGQKKKARVVPEASVMGSELVRPVTFALLTLSLAVLATTPRARVSQAQEQGRLSPSVDAETAALDHITSARYFVPSADWMKDITKRILRQAGFSIDFRAQ